VINLSYISESSIQSKKNLLYFFYPKLNIKEEISISNKESKLVKICSKNTNISDLVNRFDMVEV